jgi:hypothetical protein
MPPPPSKRRRRSLSGSYYRGGVGVKFPEGRRDVDRTNWSKQGREPEVELKTVFNHHKFQFRQEENNNMRWLIACLVALFLVAPAMAGEDPYIAIVGKDTGANPFYMSPKYTQFLYDETLYGIPLAGEKFSTNASLIQPEVCDTLGTITGPGGFDDRGNVNAKISANNQGTFEWKIHVPKKPSGEINICIQCGILKPNAWAFEGYNSVLLCAAETGERVGAGLCVREEVDAGQNPVINTALPQITATAQAGIFSPFYIPGSPPSFTLTAFRNPSDYFLKQVVIPNPPDPLTGFLILNSESSQMLDGSEDTRVLLKSCMDKCIVAKLPVTGQRNANGELEFDLEAGDLITVKMSVPRDNSVDIYCHQESAKIMGIGEAWY